MTDMSMYVFCVVDHVIDQNYFVLMSTLFFFVLLILFLYGMHGIHLKSILVYFSDNFVNI